MKITSLLLTFHLVLSLKSVAQCDWLLYEKMGNELTETSFLKRYSIESKGNKTFPFSREYSYVLTNGHTYFFYLEQSKNYNHAVNFSLSDTDGNSLDSFLVVRKIDDKNVWSFTCMNTGIYYFTVHAKENGLICAVLQLSYIPPQKSVPCDLTLFSKIDSPDASRWNEIKKYSLNGKKSTQFSYVLTKGVRYQVFIEQSNNKVPDVGFQLLNSKKAAQKYNIIKKDHDEGGASHVFEIYATGIYYLDFELGKVGICAVAQLSSQLD